MLGWFIIGLYLCGTKINKNRKKMRKILGLLVLLLSMQVYAGTTENQVQDEAPESVELEKGNSDKRDYV